LAEKSAFQIIYSSKVSAAPKMSVQKSIHPDIQKHNRAKALSGVPFFTKYLNQLKFIDIKIL